jgi:hypothetical protein
MGPITCSRRARAYTKSMRPNKLFHVLVVAGGALGATACSSGDENPPSTHQTQTSTSQTSDKDGGSDAAPAAPAPNPPPPPPSGNGSGSPFW